MNIINRIGFGYSAPPVTSGGLWGWGYNNNGQLGLGNTTNYSSPVEVGALTDWVTVRTGGHTLVIKSDGTLWACGWNDYGQLGTGNRTTISSPVQVGALTDWKDLGLSCYASYAIKTGGTLWSWGVNGNGELGVGNTTYYSSPVQVGALTTWSKVSAGGESYYGTNFAAATKTDGTLWAWGNNSRGQLGQNNTTAYSSPVQVGSDTDWAWVACSGWGGLSAIKPDGTLWACGGGNSGGLGLGNTNDYSVITQVGALTDWKHVEMSRQSTYAIKTDGTLWSWGRNGEGQLGLGNTTNYSSPVKVGALTDWATLPKFGWSAFDVGVIKTDGTLWTWGDNGNGGLGQGSSGGYTVSPVQVGALTTWKFIAVGGDENGTGRNKMLGTKS